MWPVLRGRKSLHEACGFHQSYKHHLYSSFKSQCSAIPTASSPWPCVTHCIIGPFQKRRKQGSERLRVSPWLHSYKELEKDSPTKPTVKTEKSSSHPRYIDEGYIHKSSVNRDIKSQDASSQRNPGSPRTLLFCDNMFLPPCSWDMDVCDGVRSLTSSGGELDPQQGINLSVTNCANHLRAQVDSVKLKQAECLDGNRF